MREQGGSWIKVIRESEATGETKEYYDRMRGVNNSYGEANAPAPLDVRPGGESVGPPTLSSLNPKAMLHARELMMEIMRGPSRLTPAQREMVATVTSLTAACRF